MFIGFTWGDNKLNACQHVRMPQSADHSIVCPVVCACLMQQVAAVRLSLKHEDMST